MMRSLFTLIALVLVITNAFPQVPEPSSPPRLVNDFTNSLNKQFVTGLEQELVAFNDSTSNQIVLIAIESLNGMDAAMMANRIGEEWGIGQSELDNGVVILYVPKKKGQRGSIFIAPGKGLEGVIPDVVANRIVEQEMIPSFKANRIEEGLYQGIQLIKALSSGEISTDAYQKSSKKPFPVQGIVFFIGLIGFVVFMNYRRVKSYSVGHDVPFWTALLLMNSAGRHRGRYNDFSSGRGGFGGGGFGGFGGGSFGGGGAGGSW